MNQSHQKRNNRAAGVFGFAFFCVLSLLLSPVWSPAALAEEKGAAASEQEEPEKLDAQAILEEVLKSHFTYLRENRSDPFTPFVKKQKQTARTSQQVATDHVAEEEEEVLSGMQLFEPGQLTLVSIVLMEKKALAMVEDSLGKGYIIETGTKVGRRGVVEDILPNVVVIKQWSESVSGKRRYKNIEMVLRKEGE